MELSDDDRPFPVAESNVTTAHLDANPGFSDQLGPTPPPAPRTIAGVGPRYPFKGPLISFAAIWSAISVPMFLLFLFNGQILGALFLSGFVAIGWYSGRLAWKPALARMKAWEAGVATPAIVRSTGRANYAVDGRSPFKLDYAFEVDGVVHEGSRITFDSEITRYEEGQPMWVVHLPEDPSISAEWPPIV
jgi:hypothetical protein